LQPPRTELTAVAPSASPQATVAETVALVARGDEFFAARDITSARLFYDRAANMGDGRAALRMGETFDRAFLERAGIRGAGSDQQQALSWYNRARNLGNAAADRLLKTLGVAQ
jgi:TPR repeat protein